MAIKPIFEFGSRLIATSAQELLASDKRPPIVYLRSFAADREISEAERVLVQLLEKSGPVTALGRPGELAPRLGAARLYAPKADWQETVSSLLLRANVVLLVAGATKGLTWELRECRRQLMSNKLIIVVPQDKGDFERFSELFLSIFKINILHFFVIPKYTWSRTILEAINYANKAQFGFTKPSTTLDPLIVNGLITFGADWQPTLHPVQANEIELQQKRDLEYGGRLQDWRWRTMFALKRAIEATGAGAIQSSSHALHDDRYISSISRTIDIKIAHFFTRVGTLIRTLYHAFFFLPLIVYFIYKACTYLINLIW